MELKVNAYRIFCRYIHTYTLLTIPATFARALGLMGYKECHVVSEGKQVIKFANARNRDRICLFSQNEV